MCLNHLSFKIPESNLLIDGVSAIGRKLPGDDGSSLAAPFGMSLTAATFQAEGTVPSMMTLLKRSRRAGWSEGHLFMMEYEIRSRGDGADENLAFLIARDSSSSVIGDISIEQPETGGVGDDIHDGVLKL